MSFLLFFFVLALVLILLVLSFGISLIRGILSIIFPSLRPKTRSAYGQSTDYRGNSNAEHTSTSNRKKIFDSKEGDYADYEEIKN